MATLNEIREEAEAKGMQEGIGNMIKNLQEWLKAYLAESNPVPLADALSAYLDKEQADNERDYCDECDCKYHYDDDEGCENCDDECSNKLGQED